MSQGQDPCRDDATIQALIHDALDEMQQEDSAKNSAFWRLQRCASREVFDAARHLCKSHKPLERALGVVILGQFGPIETDANTGSSRLVRKFAEETVRWLLAMLETESEPEVLYSLGVAFGHMQESRAVEPLSKLSTHPDADVRYGVVFGLLSQASELAIRTLIELSQDVDLSVRDWATFGLGSMLEVDTPEIRAALLKNIDDGDETTRYEALAGLAHRRDERILERIVQEILSGQVEANSAIGEVFCEMINALRDKLDPAIASSILNLCEDHQNP